ncbi:MAG: transglycosylase domain-containing protein [Patescibacteria group bacterium]
MFEKIVIKIRRVYRKFRPAVATKNFVFLCAGALVLLLGFGVIWASRLEIPDFSSFEERLIASSTKIYDRSGEIVLYDIHRDVRRTNIAFADMGANIKNATVAVEDSDFYNHSGIRISSILRATFANIFGGATQGGSTITQQLVKNTLLNPKKSVIRKIKEWILALKIERALPKEKILELYLNEVPYGGTIYGIEEASRNYFGKNAKDLSLAEAAYLAAIPQSPSFLSPHGKNVGRLEERKNFVLFRMRELSFITEEEYQSAKNTAVVFLPQTSGSIKAPHFVFFIKEYLEQKYGPEMVENGGLKVISTLDWPLEAKAEEIVKEGALLNERDWNGSNAGLVAIDPQSGQILAMVGSRDYFDKEIDGNYNIATARRQPGSSFKPFIYATAFNEGFTPDTILFDLPTEFQTTCNASGVALPGRNQDDCYMPVNYDGGHRGPMKLRDALAQSINIPAVKLFYLAGTRNALELARSMGISTLTDLSRYGLTLVIGGGEVTLLDMTSAFGIFAADGIRNPYTGILKVEDAVGNTLEEFTLASTEVLPKNTALVISDILSDNIARAPTFGTSSPLLIPGYDTAAKTGTTNNNKDAWTIGYTPSIAVGVWVGNNDNKPMKKGGAALAGPIWNKFMSLALQSLPNERFEEPDLSSPADLKPVLRGFWQGGESFLIDKISGKLATALTPPETIEERVITNVHTILHWVRKGDPLGSAPEDPRSDPQYSHWEIPVQNWWAQNKRLYPTVSNFDKPIGSDDVHTESSRPRVTILEPSPDMVYSRDSKIVLKLESSGRFPLEKIDVFVNDVFVGSASSPSGFSFNLETLDNLRAKNELRVISYDRAWNRTETLATFQVSN